MLHSMTGFGRGEFSDSQKQLTVEMKTVNNRYVDIIVKMPRRYSLFEDRIKKMVKEKIKRGRVEIYINIESVGGLDNNVCYNSTLAKNYYNAINALKSELNIEDHIGISQIIRYPDVLKVEPQNEDEDEVWIALKESIDNALVMLLDMRMIEGKKLKEDIESRCNNLDNLIQEIEKRAPLVVNEYKVKLNDRISEILDKTVQMDENRMALEIAIFADKSNIDEELVRFKSHIEQFMQGLKSNVSVGRKFDFIIQEMNRETNTIGSKANDLIISKHVVEIKSEIEKIREQIQNVE